MTFLNVFFYIDNFIKKIKKWLTKNEKGDILLDVARNNIDTIQTT